MAVGSTPIDGDSLPSHDAYPLAESTTLLTATALKRAPSAGQAKLTQTPLCAAGAFTPLVTGRNIAKVRWLLDGKPLHGRTLRPSYSYSTSIKLTSGRHMLVVTVTFRASTSTPDITFTRTVAVCKPL